MITEPPPRAMQLARGMGLTAVMMPLTPVTKCVMMALRTQTAGRRRPIAMQAVLEPRLIAAMVQPRRAVKLATMAMPLPRFVIMAIPVARCAILAVPVQRVPQLIAATPPSILVMVSYVMMVTL